MKKSDLVDIIGGTQPLTNWVKDVNETARRNPDYLLVELEKQDDERYYGKIYIDKSCFERRY